MKFVLDQPHDFAFALLLLFLVLNLFPERINLALVFLDCVESCFGTQISMADRTELRTQESPSEL